MGVVAYASLPHYFDHLAPVVQALRDTELRGVGSVLRGVEAPARRPWGDPLRRDRTGLIYLVASYADALRVAPAPVILLEHGAGQSYHGDPAAASSGSYSGGEGLEGCVLFLCPNESVADRWRARYRAPAVVVGCPKLDRWHAAPARAQSAHPATVAISFHWSNPLCPESQWALPHYRAALRALRDDLASAGVRLIGHGHPRAWRQLRQEWGRAGIEPVRDLADVFDRADLLLVDNSSAGYEFASLGRPVVWLSAPWYRREVHHGGRFWNDVEGMPHVEQPEDLSPIALSVLTDPMRWEPGRARMVASAYAFTDGRASERAATAITQVVRGLSSGDGRTPPLPSR